MLTPDGQYRIDLSELGYAEPRSARAAPPFSPQPSGQLVRLGRGLSCAVPLCAPRLLGTGAHGTVRIGQHVQTLACERLAARRSRTSLHAPPPSVRTLGARLRCAHTSHDLPRRAPPPPPPATRPPAPTRPTNEDECPSRTK